MTSTSRPATAHLAPSSGGAGARRRVRNLCRVVALLTATVIGLLGAAPSAQADTVAAASAAMDTAIPAYLTSLETKTSDKDPRYLEDNVWHDGTPDCFRCAFGPAVLSAQYAVSGASFDEAAMKVAVDTIDLGIADHQRPDGAFIPAATNEGGPDIQTLLFANVVAEVYLILGPHLDADHQKRWASSLKRSATWLIRNGNLTWYTNGNLNLALTMNMDLTYKITGSWRFKQAAKKSLAFTLHPPQRRWPGFGLQYSKAPSKADGSDGAAYLAESGGEDPGYDPAYSLFQSNLAAFWYLLTGDKAAERLTNLLYNQMLPRVRKSDWTIDVSGGTRRAAPGVRYRFGTSALVILALKGGRTELRDDVQSQTKIVLDDYRGALDYSHAAYSYNYGAELTPIYRMLMTAR